MKHATWLSLVLAFSTTIVSGSAPEAWRDAGALRDRVRAGCLMPFSMTLGREPAQFEFRGSSNSTASDGWQRTTARYREKRHPLQVELVCEFPPTMEMIRTTLRLTASTELTTEIRQISILDLAVPRREATLHGQTGGFADDRKKFPSSGSRPWSRPVVDGAPLDIDSGRDGRSSNQRLPIWLYAESDGGIWYWPEWSGCWSMSIRDTPEGRRLLVGLPTLECTMRAGESIALPSIAWGPYSGSVDDGFNRLRCNISRYFLPKVNGKMPQPMVYWQGYGGHPTYATEEELYREVDAAARIGCEVFCLDGGWNMLPGQNWFLTVGRWEDQCRFPRGLKTFGAYVKSKGMRFGLWIEPRATKGCPLYERNPRLFHPGNEGLMRLDLPGGVAMFEGVFEQLIRDYGADFVWLDYNVAPRAKWWNAMEPAGRKGLVELGFYQGWYQAIDEILHRHPNLWIESCASGGRIIDLGQLRRSQSIWVADEALLDDACRNRRDALNRVLPAVCIQGSLFLAPEFVGAVNLVNVKHLVLRNLTIRNPDAFSIRLGEVEGFLVEDVVLDHPVRRPNQDGVHVGGFSNRGMIRRIKAVRPNTPNDDMVALNADDDVERVINLGMRRGPIRETVVEDLQADGACTFVRILSAGSLVENVVVRRVTGSCRYHAVNMNRWRFPPGSGDIRNVRLEQFRVAKTDPAMPQLIDIQLNVRNVQIRDFVRNDDSRSAGAATLAIKNGRENLVRLDDGPQQQVRDFSIPRGSIKELLLNP